MVQQVLDRTERMLVDLAAAGLANAGPALGEVPTLAQDLAAARLGRLGERLQALADAPDDRARTAAWATAWAALGLVRTRLLKARAVDAGDVLALPQSPHIVFPRPAGDLESREGLVATLCAAAPLVRAYAAGRLAALGDAAVPDLLATQKVCGRCIRFLVVDALARIASPAAVEGLLGLLGDADVARPVEAALLRVGEQAVPGLAKAMEVGKKPSRETERRRAAAAKVLWRLGEQRALQPFLNDDDALVAALAQGAQEKQPAWTTLLSSKSPWTALLAAAALLERGQLPLDDLRVQLDALSKPQLEQAAALLRHTGAEAPVLDLYLGELATAGRKEERERGARMVAHLGSPDALPTLLRLIEAGNPLATDPLGEIADPAATWLLIRRVELLPAYLAQPAVEALGRLGDPAAVPVLLQALGSARPGRGSLRDEAERALVDIGGPAVAPVADVLLHLPEDRRDEAPTLERLLRKISTPAARAALRTYQSGTDELPRLLAHLAEDKVPKQVWEGLRRQGTAALEPLLALVAQRGNRVQQANAVRALARLAPDLEAPDRERVIGVMAPLLRAECRSSMPSMTAWPGTVGNPLGWGLVRTLCAMDAQSAAAELQGALFLGGAGEAIVERWKVTQQPWLLEVIARGIQDRRTVFGALEAAGRVPANTEVLTVLWAPVTEALRNETEAHILQKAVECVHAWRVPQAGRLLQTLRRRLASLSGQPWWKNGLERALDKALKDLNPRNPLQKLFKSGK